jgi:hypothetical protein
MTTDLRKPAADRHRIFDRFKTAGLLTIRSEEHTSELQSL